MRKSIPYIIVALITLIMVFYPDKSIMYAKTGLDMCFEIIVPSLFPFFVCSGILIYSGLASGLSKYLSPVMKPLFNVNGCGAAAFITGIISGYPLGAITACQLYDSGYLSKTETERLLAFCNNSGPLFILGAVGSAMYANAKVGIILYTSHIAASFSVGLLFRFYAKDRHKAPDYKLNQPERSFSEVFSEVMTSSVSSILTVCAAVIFFSSVSNIFIQLLPNNDTLRALFTGIMELTGGTRSIYALSIPLTQKLVLSAFVVGFAGICVHLQVTAVVTKYGLSLRPYIFGKLLHGALAAIYTLLFLRLFPLTDAVFLNTAPQMSAGFCMSSVYTAVSVVFVLAVAFFSVLFGCNVKKKKA